MKPLTSLHVPVLLIVIGATAAAAHAEITPPQPDVWFSLDWPVRLLPVTAADSRVLRPGDVLSASGRVVATNRDLLANFHPMPSPQPTDYGLDALLTPPVLSASTEMAPSPRPILFSTEKGFFDERLGVLVSDGDLLSSEGRIVATNRQLLSGFHPMPVVGDYGLDAVFVFGRDPATDTAVPPEVWFSIERGFFDEAKGVHVKPGDVLSSRGRIVATNEELLKAFEPVRFPGHEDRGLGLDALFVPPLQPAADLDAPNAKPVIWFSTERGFYSKRLHRWIGQSDLISSDGRVIVTGFELLHAFGPHWPRVGGLDAITLAAPILDPLTADALVNAYAVPEPATACLLLLGGAMAAARRRR